MNAAKFYAKKLELLTQVRRDLQRCQVTLEELVDHEDTAPDGDTGDITAIQDSLKEAEGMVNGLTDAVRALLP
jgi:hypothetical protein